MLLAVLEWWYGIDWGRLRRGAAELVVAALAFLALAIAVTWPVLMNLNDVILGGGELGGWLWRQWWHFSEVDAVAHADLSLWAQLSQLVGLGRYPETGNILDILLLGYWLDGLLGMPASHNIKVLVILVGNGLCGYALARSLSPSRTVAIAAGTLAILNPIVIQDINKTGLRQVVLWWLLLYPVFLTRAWRSGGRMAGAAAGVCFALVAAFYWFYGLFAAMFTVLHIGGLWLQERTPWRRVARWALPYVVVGTIGVAFFVSPYLASGADSGGSGGITKLPELTFFLPFPDYDTIADAPLRPSNYRENVLSSLHRTVESAWPADYVIDPRHGVLALPAAAFLMGVLPAFLRRRSWGWLSAWLLFYAGTLGPFLKLGAQRDTSEVVRLGEYVVRLPYAIMFQVVPGMSRMFAPYRMGSMVVVTSVGLLALSLGSVKGIWRRRVLGAVATVAIVLQPFYRFDLGPIGEGQARPEMWRVPTQVSAMRLPDWYEQLDPDGWEGIIELPLEQQQDLICAYQAVHRRKVYRSWATEPAIPPLFRKRGGGESAKRLRWLASEEPRRDEAESPLRDLSRKPMEADLSQLTDAGFQAVRESGDYRYIVIHERGYYLLDPKQGATLYRHVVRELTERFGVAPLETVEQEAFEWPGKARSFPVGPAWIPWASREVQLPTQEMPRRYFMAVFDLNDWAAATPED